MEILGLLGYPVEHSYSKKMHSAVIKHLSLAYEYNLFSIPPEKISLAVEGMRLFGFRGLNVTVPYKTAVMEYLDEIDASATLCGAVNTIVNKNGSLVGYNTDYDGFKRALDYHNFDISGKNILVLGAGGASRAVVAALVSMNAAKIYLVNRTLSSAEKLAALFPNIQALSFEDIKSKNIMSGVDGVINTTTIGMYPDVDATPLFSANELTGISFVYDIIYNPLKTTLLKQAEQAGCKIANGLEMLIQQGALGFYLWTGIHPPVDVMRKALAEEETR